MIAMIVHVICCTSLSLSLSLSFFQPVLDIGLYVYQLTGSVGAQGPLTMLAYLAISGVILTR